MAGYLTGTVKTCADSTGVTVKAYQNGGLVQSVDGQESSEGVWAYATVLESGNYSVEATCNTCDKTDTDTASISGGQNTTCNFDITPQCPNL